VQGGNAPTRVRNPRPGLTLEKIAEIEAQMSRQWWSDDESSAATVVQPSQIPSSFEPLQQKEAKPLPAPEGGHAPPPLAQIPLLSDALPPASGPVPLSLQDLLRPPEEQALPSLQDLFGLEKPWDGTIARAAGTAPAPAAQAAAPVPAAAADDPSIPLEPQLQEAAVLFANGDTDAAEHTLRALIEKRQAAALPAQLPLWLALVQLYRAAGRAEAFERTALELAARFGRSPPQWFAMLQTQQGSTHQGFRWNAPAQLNAQALAALGSDWAQAASPWTIDFAALANLDNDSAAPLRALLQQWVDAEGRFVLLHAEKLLLLLTGRSPSGDAKVPQDWWLARMLLLRVLGEQEEFDSAALDYCVTYEVSPPWWEPPRCQCMQRETGAAAQAPAAADAATAGPRPLAGVFVGDISAWLQALAPAAGAPLVLDCSQLTRMDAAAAAALLQWARKLHAQGSALELHHLHYLLAAFLYLNGIAPYARVVPRSD